MFYQKNSRTLAAPAGGRVPAGQLTDPQRGITVELLLTLLIAARRRGINPQLVALSAVIGGTNQFNDWLGVDILRTDRRPVPLTESVIDRTGTLHYEYVVHHADDDEDDDAAGHHDRADDDDDYHDHADHERDDHPLSGHCAV